MMNEEEAKSLNEAFLKQWQENDALESGVRQLKDENEKLQMKIDNLLAKVREIEMNLNGCFAGLNVCTESNVEKGRLVIVGKDVREKILAILALCRDVKMNQ